MSTFLIRIFSPMVRGVVSLLQEKFAQEKFAQLKYRALSVSWKSSSQIPSTCASARMLVATDVASPTLNRLKVLLR